MTRRTPFALTLLSTLLLTACGGGGDTTPNAVTPVPSYLEGPVGQLVGLAPEVLALGTYTVSNCVDASNNSVSRKLRLMEDGSVVWLDAANNDAVLARFTPSTTAIQYRIMEVYDNGSYYHEVNEYASGGARTLQIRFDTEDVIVNTSTVQDTCSSSPQVPTVLNISVALNDAIVARKLSSAVRSTGADPATGSLSQDETISTLDAATSTQVTYRVRRSVSATGVISHQIDNNAPVVWTNWITALQASNGTRGYYSEVWDTFTGTSSSAANASGTPANPRISVELAHPTLRLWPGSGNAFVMLQRDTASQANGQAFMVSLPQ
ncbi:hypothetical protein EYS42_15240 [Aquabacterium lacunae]|uniref:Uncharacterized protein n=1 Tax=Aquabacterium lacunae TaxID=2528630 RepID=A0A4Q9H2P3_9BURK|nr:hypothetical protein [Aquabacterium lacunae]TBO28358.1 hypothetical protein EYS42_15240 [Aquabacterium lacunae]